MSSSEKKHLDLIDTNAQDQMSLNIQKGAVKRWYVTIIKWTPPVTDVLLALVLHAFKRMRTNFWQP